METSRPYWEHLAQRGDITPVDPSNLAATNYQVLPQAAASSVAVENSSTPA